MTRNSTFTVATFAAIAVVSLASTGAFAHGGGGGGFGGGGGGFGGGHAGGFGSMSVPGGYAHGPYAAGSIARSSVISRLPQASGHHNVPVVSRIPQAIADHSNIQIVSKIPQLVPIPTTPPTPIRTPRHNNGWDGHTVVVPIDIGGCGVVDGVVGVDGQVVQTVQTNCSCLTKQYLADGSVLFQDVCSQEAARQNVTR